MKLPKAEQQYIETLRKALLKTIAETKGAEGIETGRAVGIVAFLLLRMSAEFHLGLVGGEEFFKKSALRVFAEAQKDFEKGIARAMARGERKK